MALSETMSNPNDWLQFYNIQNNTLSTAQSLPSLPHAHATSPAAAAMFTNHSVVPHHEAAVVITTATPSLPAAAAPNPSSSTTNTNINNSLSPEGRVSKPVRKRSRASRRTPTTLLNTDTANFRAMVQQFTGGSSTASFAAQPPGATNFCFGQGFVNPNASSVMMPPGYNHLQLQLQQQHPYLLSLNNHNSNSDVNQGFVQRLMSSSSSSARPTNMGVPISSSAEFLSRDQGGVASQVQGGQQPSSLVGGGRPNSNSSNENRSNSFLY